MEEVHHQEEGECCGTRMTRYKPEGEDETRGGGGGVPDPAEGVNLYLFSENNKLQELPEEFSPELERKVMVI